jgi:threonine dehydratase
MGEAAGLIEQAPDLEAIRAARERIRGVVRRTPVLGSPAIDAICGARIVFKCESLQEIGAFKARGASNAILLLSEGEAAKGVVTHSSGNHGAAVAWAAARRGIPAWVVMPTQAAAVKQEAVKAFGGKVKHCGPTVQARERACASVQATTGATLIHPYNDWRVIAGQGTAALELLEEVSDLDAVIAPVGGGGLLSGTAIAAKGLEPSIKVYGAEPAGADDAFQSLRAGRIIPQTDPHTIADGLRSSLGDKTFAVIRARADGIGTASEEAIVAAMRLLWEKLRLVIEPSGAVPLACLLAKKLPVERRRVGIILSGGNVDLDHLPWQN